MLEQAPVFQGVPYVPSSINLLRFAAGQEEESPTTPLDFTAFCNSRPSAYAGMILSDIYRLERKLGQGGMGEVWLATHLMLNEPRTIKLMLNCYTANSELRQRFIFQEARYALQLNHPNIVRMYELNQYRGIPYLVMEYISNIQHKGDLRSLLKIEGKLSVKRTGEILKQVAKALDAMHGQGLIHCDLKPANILINDKGEIKLGDFGLVMALEGALEDNGCIKGTGTYHYMAPEQARGEAEPCSDIYSLGVMLYELLTGRVPFKGDRPSLIAQHALVPPLPLSHFDPSIPLEVEAVIMKALAKKPAERYNSGLELTADYHNALKIGRPPQVSSNK